MIGPEGAYAKRGSQKLSIAPILGPLFAMSRARPASVNAASFRCSRARSAWRPSCFVVSGRFRQTLEIVRQTAAPNWGRVAVDSGYYDQSHLIHDFRFFSNLSPTEFVRQRSDCVMQNHATLVG
jgi:hypothetical protein